MTDQVQERRRPDTVVTSENLAEFQKHKLDIADTVKAPVIEKIEEKTNDKAQVDKASTDKIADENASEAVTKADGSVREGAKESSSEDDKETNKVLKKTHSKLEQRFSELTQQRNAERLRAESAERKAAELEAKLKPTEIKTEDDDKPDKTKYTDAFQYAEDLAVWSAKSAIKEKEASDRKAQIEKEQEAKITSWKDRVEKTKLADPEFMDKIIASNVQVSEEVREAIMDSDVGPRILLHLAENPEEAERIGKLTVGKAMIALGKLEAKYSEPPKTEAKTEVKQAEISKAPPPITPLKGASASADLPIDSKGEWTGTHEQYREARRAGKIK